jgi:nitrate/nitrite transport system permease protein
MALKDRIVRGLELSGFDVLAPFVRLAAREEPREQVRQIALSLGAPAIAFALFLLAWGAVAARLETSIGAVPGPAQVVAAARGLALEHRAERAREAEFYARMEERKAKAERAGRTWKERRYSGSPTYLDQIGTSLRTVFAGFVLASLVAIPLGILCGTSATVYAAVNPLIQLFRPVSPLAWLPIVMIVVSATYTSADPWLEKSFVSSAITVALCSLWPTLVNTAVGVAAIDKDHLNVARVLQLPFGTRVRKIVIPASLPYIFTGLRLSLGVGWMVLIAAEMLAQNPGLGKFVWDMFQNGSAETLARIAVAVFTIGGIGFALDRCMIALQRLASRDVAIA